MVQVTFNFTQILFVPIPVILVILMFKMLIGPFSAGQENQSNLDRKHILVIFVTWSFLYKKWPHIEPRMVFLRNVKFSTFKQSVHSNKYMHAWVKFLPQISG